MRRPALLVSVVAAAVALVMGAAWVVFESSVRPRASAPPAPAAAAPREPRNEEAIVESVVGQVLRATAAGWSPLETGTHLHVEDSIRTGPAARTALRIGDKSVVTVAQGSQLSIRELTERVHRFRLSRGHVSVDYKPDGERVLRIEGESGDAVAETRAAQFTVLSTGRSIAIATESGEVDLTARGKTVAVAAGHQAIARNGQAPGAAEPVPASVWLKVANALTTAPEQVCAEVRGTAPRGAEVTVDGEHVDVADDGSFVARVARRNGAESALVATRDASGRTTTRRVPCAEGIGAASDVALQWRKDGH